VYTNFERYDLQKRKIANKPFTSGVYNVVKYAVNKDTMPPLTTDTLRWQDVIIDEGENGSIKTSDTSFRRRYGRAYFYYTTDTAKNILYFHKNPKDSFGFFYQTPDFNNPFEHGMDCSKGIFLLSLNKKIYGS